MYGVNTVCHPIVTRKASPVAYTRKRGKKYQGFYKRDGRQIYVASGLRRADVLKVAEDAERADRLGERLDPQKPKTLFADFATNYVNTTLSGARATRSKKVLNVQNHLVPFFAGKRMKDLDTSMARLLINALAEKGLKPWTVHGIYGLFQMMMATALDEGYLHKNPCTKKVREALPSIRKDTMRAERYLSSVSEVEHLADCIYPRYRLAILLMGYMGLRRGEMAGLQRADVDLKQGVLSVNWTLSEVDGILELKEPKTAASRRRIPIPESLQGDIRKHLLAYTGKSSYVITSRQGNRIRPNTWVKRNFTPAVEKAGFAPLTPHHLRHTAVSLLIAQGAHAKEIQTFLGHSTYQVTMDVYGHLLPGQHLELVHKLDNEVKDARRAPL